MTSLANALKDFGRPARAPAEPFPLDAFAPPPIVPASSHPAVDMDAAIQAAVREAEEALAARLGEAHAAQMEDMRQTHAQERAAMLEAMGADLAGQIVARLSDMEARLVELTTSVAARILGSALTGDLADKAVARLAAVVSGALRDDETLRVTVTGPVSLFETLRDALPAHAGQLHFEESHAADLSVTIDENLYETRIAEWSSAVSEVLS